MNITIKKTLDVTAPLETYIEEKLMPLAKFVKAFDRDGVVELKLEVSRSSNHHRKGDEVFVTQGREALHDRHVATQIKHFSVFIRRQAIH